MVELFVPFNGPARFSAGSAYLRARGAGYNVVRRPTEHEVGARLAQLGAVEKDADEVDLRVGSADRKAVLHGHGADGVTIHALLDALLQLFMRTLMGLIAVVFGLLHVDLRAG